jgi:hypothetical protein
MRAAAALLAALLLALAIWLIPILSSGGNETATAELSPATGEVARVSAPRIGEARELRRDASESPAVEAPAAEELALEVAPGASSAAKPEVLADDLRIRVVDGITRTPIPDIGLQVGWEIQTPNGRSTSGIRYGRTGDPEGELRIPRAEVEQRRQERGAEGHLLVRAMGIFGQAPELRARVEPWPTAALELALPPFGWVGFDTVDELGRALDASGTLELRSMLPDSSYSWERLEVQGGTTSKLPCGVDAAFEVTGELNDGAPLERRALRGPRAPSVTERHALRRERAGSSIALRVLVAPDAPLRSTSLQVSLEEERKKGGSSMSSSTSSSQDTDGEGWLRLVLEDPSGGDGLRRTLTLATSRDGRGRRSAFLDLSRSFPPGETVLGDLLLAEEPLLASGRVIDRRGRPIAAVEVSAEALDANGAEVGGHWMGAETDANGRFEIRSPLNAARARLRARGKGYLDSPLLEIAAAAREIEITLEAAASLRGSVVLPQGMEPRSVSVHVASDGSREGSRAQEQIAANGSFAIAGVTPGIAKVIFLWNHAAELATVPEVRLVAGEENQDPRLQGLELARGWRPLALRLLGPTGEVLAGLDGELRIDAEPRARAFRTDPEGHLDDWIPPDALRCVLAAENHRPIPFDWAPSRQDLRLEAGIRVALPVEADLIEPILHLRVYLQGDGGARSRRALVTNGVAELVVPAPGAYEVRVEYTLQVGGGTLVSTLPLHPAVRVEIGADDSQRLPALRIDAAQLRAALEAK